MKGSETPILRLLGGNKDRYVIPVYQRKYSWNDENCRQLFEDLLKVINEQRPSHFCGSIVSKVEGNGSGIDYQIIDGQQRLTTVILLLLAMRNLIIDKEITPKDPSLAEQINESYLIDKWNTADSIKLHPVESDRAALHKLFAGHKEDFDNSSRLTLSYNFFRNAILGNSVSVDQLFVALNKLEIISITLEATDNAQIIFESLNSTGLALTEGDKIRNYILMGLASDEQAKFYNDYWLKIEDCTNKDVSAFVRDFLSIKQQATPRIDRVYTEFKKYAVSADGSIEQLLQELLRYARLYRQLTDARSSFNNKQLDACLYRLNHLEITVTRPFLLEVLSLCQDGKITPDDTLRIFLTVESFIFRRYICQVPINALGKLFASLDREICRYDGTGYDNYLNKFIYALRSKSDNVRFPDNNEFADQLEQTNVYQMRARYRVYIFERFENYDTSETKDVLEHINNKDYSIEHIMPQHLTAIWEKSLGEKADAIHQKWLHRLANLTLTAYNSELSNKSFVEKRDAPKGYKASGLRMNQKIAQKETWGEAELIERNKDMIAQALNIWPLPDTDYKPHEREMEFYTLDDDKDMTYANIAKFSYEGREQTVRNWTDMLERIVNLLHAKNSSVLTDLAYSDKQSLPDVYVSSNPATLNKPVRIDEHIYIETNSSTTYKIYFLRQLFDLYGIDRDNLVFYLKRKGGQESLF